MQLSRSPAHPAPVSPSWHQLGTFMQPRTELHHQPHCPLPTRPSDQLSGLATCPNSQRTATLQLSTCSGVRGPLHPLPACLVALRVHFPHLRNSAASDRPSLWSCSPQQPGVNVTPTPVIQPHHLLCPRHPTTMASLNLSINGPSIKSSYNGVVNGPAPSSSSPTHAQWALFSVQAPLLNAFQDSGAKESILKVQGTGGMPTTASY